MTQIYWPCLICYEIVSDSDHGLQMICLWLKLVHCQFNNFSEKCYGIVWYMSFRPLALTITEIYQESMSAIYIISEFDYASFILKIQYGIDWPIIGRPLPAISSCWDQILLKAKNTFKIDTNWCCTVSGSDLAFLHNLASHDLLHM